MNEQSERAMSPMWAEIFSAVNTNPGRDKDFIFTAIKRHVNTTAASVFTVLAAMRSKGYVTSEKQKGKSVWFASGVDALARTPTPVEPDNKSEKLPKVKGRPQQIFGVSDNEVVQYDTMEKARHAISGLGGYIVVGEISEIIQCKKVVVEKVLFQQT